MRVTPPLLSSKRRSTTGPGRAGLLSTSLYILPAVVWVLIKFECHRDERVGLKLSQWKALSPKYARRVKTDKNHFQPVLQTHARMLKARFVSQHNSYLYVTAATKWFVYLYMSFTSCPGIGASTGREAYLDQSLIWIQLIETPTLSYFRKDQLHGHRAGACKSIPTYCCWSTSARRRPPRQRATGVGGQSSFLVTCGD